MRTKLLQTLLLGVAFGMVGCGSEDPLAVSASGGSTGVNPTSGGSGGSAASATGGNLTGTTTGGTATIGNGGSGNTGTSTGGAVALGGNGSQATGGQATGGKASAGGAATGGKAAGGSSSGGSSQGGAAAGGAATGGKAAGGSATGGISTVGGAATGGKAATGGAISGGTATGGAATGGKAATGGAATGGTATGGAATGGKAATGGAASTCTEANKTLTANATGTHCGYTYEYWKDSGTGSLILKPDGYSVSWSGINNLLGRKGLRPGSKTQIVSYEANYQPSGNSYLCVYGWTRSPLIEYYIVDSWGTWKPPGGTTMGTVSCDGGTYDIYRTQRVQQPSIDGTQTFYQYWSVRTAKRSSGTISVGCHFDAWAAKGLSLGSLYEVSMTVEGYQSSGTADVIMSMK